MQLGGEGEIAALVEGGERLGELGVGLLRPAGARCRVGGQAAMERGDPHDADLLALAQPGLDLVPAGVPSSDGAQPSSICAQQCQSARDLSSANAKASRAAASTRRPRRRRSRGPADVDPNWPSRPSPRRAA